MMHIVLEDKQVWYNIYAIYKSAIKNLKYFVDFRTSPNLTVNPTIYTTNKW